MLMYDSTLKANLHLQCVLRLIICTNIRLVFAGQHEKLQAAMAIC